MARYTDVPHTTLEQQLTRLRMVHLSANKRRDQTAIDVPAALWLCRALETEEAHRVLELGSGFSSWALRAWQQRCYPALELYTIDDEERWLQTTRIELHEQGLSTDHLYSFDLFCATTPEPFDIVFVDLDNMATRVAHAERFVQWTRPGGLLVLDDWHTSHYRAAMLARLAALGLVVQEAPETMDRWGRYLAWSRRR